MPYTAQGRVYQLSTALFNLSLQQHLLLFSCLGIYSTSPVTNTVRLYYFITTDIIIITQYSKIF